MSGPVIFSQGWRIRRAGGALGRALEFCPRYQQRTHQLILTIVARVAGPSWALALRARNPARSDSRRYVRDISCVPCCCCFLHFGVYVCRSFVWSELLQRSWCSRPTFTSPRSIAATSEGRLPHPNGGGWSLLRTRPDWKRSGDLALLSVYWRRERNAYKTKPRYLNSLPSSQAFSNLPWLPQFVLWVFGQDYCTESYHTPQALH